MVDAAEAAVGIDGLFAARLKAAPFQNYFAGTQ